MVDHHVIAQVPHCSAVKLAELIRTGAVSSRAALECFVHRIERLDKKTNAVVLLFLDRARTRADRADAALKRGEFWGPLHGVPCTIKENNELAGTPNTQGDPAWKDRVSKESEVMISRLLRAGAIIFGKTNLPFHAMDIQSYNAVYGATSNPWDTTRTPGGSSGGSAAAVACGFTSFELGGDIGGSIRTPAAFCGVYGHKPTFGIIPRRGPFMERVPKHISVRGPLCRSTEDLRLLLTILAGPDSRIAARGYRLELPRPTKARLREYRVAVWADEPSSCPVDDELVAASENVAVALEAAGAVVSRTARPNFDYGRENMRVYMKLTASTNALSDEPRALATALKDYRLAQEAREKIRDAWEAFFTEYDVLICPSHSTPAFTKDEREPKSERALAVTRHGATITMPYWSAIFWAVLTNTGNLPSTTFPAGIGPSSGLPLGLNVVSRELNDLVCIDFARLLQVECGFDFVAPPGFRFGEGGGTRL